MHAGRTEGACASYGQPRTPPTGCSLASRDMVSMFFAGESWRASSRGVSGRRWSGEEGATEAFRARRKPHFGWAKRQRKRGLACGGLGVASSSRTCQRKTHKEEAGRVAQAGAGRISMREGGTGEDEMDGDACANGRWPPRNLCGLLGVRDTWPSPCLGNEDMQDQRVKRTFPDVSPSLRLSLPFFFWKGGGWEQVASEVGDCRTTRPVTAAAALEWRPALSRRWTYVMAEDSRDSDARPGARREQKKGGRCIIRPETHTSPLCRPGAGQIWRATECENLGVFYYYFYFHGFFWTRLSLVYPPGP